MEPISVTSKSCFRVDGDSFALGPALSPYTVYNKVTHQSCDECAREWDEAAVAIPAGWEAVSDEIPAGTPHYVYDNVKGTVYHLAGLAADEKVILVR